MLTTFDNCRSCQESDPATCHIPDSASVFRLESSSSAAAVSPRLRVDACPTAKRGTRTDDDGGGRPFPSAAPGDAAAAAAAGHVLAVPRSADGVYVGEGDLPARQLQQVPAAQQEQRHDCLNRWAHWRSEFSLR